MSVEGGSEHDAAPPLPRSIWTVAWASVASQVVTLLQRGVRVGDDFGLLVSVIIGVLLVGYVSVGVVRARTIRVVLAFVLITLATFAQVFGLFLTDDESALALNVAAAATSAMVLIALWMFSQSEWFAWQRTRPPPDQGTSIQSLIAVAVLVGVMGAFIAPYDDGVNARINVSGP